MVARPEKPPRHALPPEVLNTGPVAGVGSTADVVRLGAPPRKAPAVGPREMDRRSWYMPRASADALAEAVEGLHWQTRQPKHVILAALIEAALQQRDQVARRLSH